MLSCQFVIFYVKPYISFIYWYLFWNWSGCLSFLDLRLLITPFVSSDYPFGIFWLPLWYILITPLVSTDYLFGIFWLPLWYHQTFHKALTAFYFEWNTLIDWLLLNEQRQVSRISTLVMTRTRLQVSITCC